MLAVRVGRDGDAIRAFTKALALEPGNEFALVHRAEAYYKTNNPDKALADIDDVFRINKQPSLRPYVLRMKIFVAYGDNAKALAQIEPMLTANSATPFAYIKAAELQIQLHQREKAIALLDRGIQVVADADIYLYRAQLRLRSDKQGRQDDIRSALALAPHSVYAHILRAELEFENGAPNAALKTLTKIIDDANVKTSRMPLLVRRGVMYLKTGKPSLAQADFDRARNSATTAKQQNDVAWEFASQNIALPTALSIASEAVEKQPDTVTFVGSKAFILLRLGRYKEAIEQYDAALKLAPQLPASLYGRGIAKWRTGQLAAGDADLKAARAAQPNIADEFAQMGVRR